MTKYLLAKLPTIILVFGLLIIIHHFQWTLAYKEKIHSSAALEQTVEGYAIVLVSTPENPVSKNLVQSALYQNYENCQVYLIDTVEGEEFPTELGLHHIQVAKEEELVKAYFDCLFSLPKGQVVVHIDAREKSIHPGMIDKFHKVFENQNIWVVYADRRLYPTRLNPKWDDARVKAFHSELVHKIHLQDIQTIEEFHKGIFYLGNEHSHFGEKLLDPKADSSF
ncbi:MAG: hypothetical protein ACOYK9_04400 [Chlamydiia bacterium]